MTFVFPWDIRATYTIQKHRIYLTNILSVQYFKKHYLVTIMTKKRNVEGTENTMLLRLGLFIAGRNLLQ